MKKIIFTLAMMSCFPLMVKALPGELDPSFDTDGKAVTQIGGYIFTGNAAAIQTNGKILVAGAVYPGNDFAIVRYNANGSLDTSFDGDGLVTTNLGSIYTDDTATAIAVQPDGKILVAGYSYSPSTEYTDFTIVRYLPSGALDASFDGDGRAATAVTNRDDVASAIALQTDGKILVGGRGRNDFAAVRYNPDGTLDGGFAAGGIFVLDIADASFDVGTSIAQQADGKILIGGYKRTVSNNDFAVVRIAADGSGLDFSFDTDGIALTDFGSNGDQLFALAPQADGKIVAAGSSENNIALARYNADGSPDTSFDGDGRLTTNVLGNASFAKAVRIQPDGKIVAAGRQYNGTDAKFVVTRYLPDGALDPGWDGDGIVSTDLGFIDDQANALVIQADGRIVAAGFAGNGFAAARYLTSGTLSCGVQLDLSFGECGKVVTQFGSAYDSAFDVTFQADGKILVAGWVNGYFGVARYLPNGSLDTSFDGDGFVSFGPPVSNIYPAVSIIVQPDGKILVAGEAANQINGFTSDFLIVRLNPDGTLDQSFSGDGRVQQDYPYFENHLWGMQLLPDGKILVVGTSNGNFSNEYKLVFSRYNSDGTRDTTYGTDGHVLNDPVVLHDVAFAPNGKIAVVGFDKIAVYNPDGSPDTGFDGDGMLTLDLDGKGAGQTFLESVAFQPNGKILVGGLFLYNNGDNSRLNDSLVIRFNENGTFDPSFDGDGMILEAYWPRQTSDLRIVDIGVQSNGKIVIAAGYKFRCGDCQILFYNSNFDLARLNSDGTLDNALFGTGGAVSSDFLMSQDQATALKIQPDGKIVVVGKVRFVPFGYTNLAIARYNGELAPPTVANVAVAGRVTAANGQGIGRAAVALTDASGTTRRVLTNPFGYYRFDEVAAGQIYTLAVSHKRYAFSPDIRVLNINDNLDGLDFTASE